MKLISWNVNGIRAADRKELFQWFQKELPGILCLQEIKALPEQVPPHLRNTPGYYIYWNPAERKGYSGVATFTKQQSIRVKKGFGIEKFDREGRVLITEFSSFVLFNVYFPNGKKDDERLEYKLDFYDTFLAYADNLKAEGKNPFTLDSKKPDGSFQKFLEGEIRYASLKRTFPEEAERLHAELEEQFNQRYEDLALMADPTGVCKEEEPVEEE